MQTPVLPPVSYATEKLFPVIVHAKKQGGAYVTAKGKVRKIDEFGGALLLVGGEKIPISAVIGIQLYNDKEQIEEG